MLLHIYDPALPRAVPAQPGVYWLIVSTTAYGEGPVQPMTIPRLGGDDPHGILYIGEGAILAVRARNQLVGGLQTCIGSENWSSLNLHRALYDYFHPPCVQKRFPKRNLALAWEQTSNRKAHEQSMIYNYRQALGERPPFNRSFGDSHIRNGAADQELHGPLTIELLEAGVRTVSQRYWPPAIGGT